jgi:hypothetical protein
MKGLAILFLIVGLFIAGCTTTSTDVCGNGIKEEGETAGNCCKDAGCPSTFKCDSEFENGSTVNFCMKVDKAGTYEAGKIKGILNDINNELIKSISNMNMEKARSKLSEIGQYSNTLKQLGYDTTTEEFIQKAIKANLDVKNLTIQRNAELDNASTDSQKLTIVKKEIEDCKGLISTLEMLKSTYNANLQEAEQVYNFDIFHNIDTWKDVLKEREEQVEAYEKQIAPSSLSLTIVIASDTTRYFHNPAITVSNEGDNDVTNLVIEAELYKEGTLVESDSDALFLAGGNSITSVPAGKTAKGYLNIMWYGDNVPAGTYTLKVSVRRGADATPLASDSATVTVGS